VFSILQISPTTWPLQSMHYAVISVGCDDFKLLKTTSVSPPVCE